MVILYVLLNLVALCSDAPGQSPVGSFKAVLEPIYGSAMRLSNVDSDVEVLPDVKIAKLQKDVVEVRAAFFKLKPTIERDAAIRLCNIAEKVFAEEKACLDQISKLPLRNSLQTEAEYERLKVVRVQNALTKWRSATLQLAKFAKIEYERIPETAAAEELQPLIIRLKPIKQFHGRMKQHLAGGHVIVEGVLAKLPHDDSYANGILWNRKYVLYGLPNAEAIADERTLPGEFQGETPVLVREDGVFTHAGTVYDAIRYVPVEQRK